MTGANETQIFADVTQIYADQFKQQSAAGTPDAGLFYTDARDASSCVPSVGVKKRLSGLVTVHCVAALSDNRFQSAEIAISCSRPQSQ